ncbi:MAG: class I SAM-dependent methyltransferase [Saprospiraceae bacterium]|nr:class I SAM-dependent methyltransferase [Saprospiraceae bacterium]
MSTEKLSLANYFEQNMESWNDRVPVHLKSEFYNVDAFLKGESALTEIEQKYLGIVSGKRVLHLQCHFGMDTLSISRLGADCVGIDFSNAAIQEARKLNELCSLNATFYESNVYDTLDLGLGLFDHVFTSYGTICWLPDLDLWAKVIADSLRKNGEFYIADFHPTLYMFDFNTNQLSYPYFNTGNPFTEVESGTYADPTHEKQIVSHFWSHSLDEIINSLLNHGLQLTVFKEFDFSPYNCFPGMKQIEVNRYQFGNEALKIPHIYLIKATKIK